MLILKRADVEQVLTLPACIEVMADTMRALARGEAVLPLRPVIGLPGENLLLVMPAALTGAHPAVGVKLLTIFGDNPARGLPIIQGMAAAFDPKDGRVLAIADAGSITAIRTAAVSGVATRALALPQADDLAILGSGVQASTHLAAMLAVRPIRRVRVWSRTPAHAQAFAQTEGARRGLSIEVCDSPNAAIEGASLICACTSAIEPIISGAQLAEGAHINAVGAYTPHMRECDTDAVQRAHVYVDSLESAWAEAGDLIIPLSEGAITRQHVAGTLGEVLLGLAPARSTPQEVTLFKSCGLAIQDAAALHFLVAQARAAGVGVEVEF
jgi:ornithine cyclodeaminase